MGGKYLADSRWMPGVMAGVTRIPPILDPKISLPLVKIRLNSVVNQILIGRIGRKQVPGRPRFDPGRRTNRENRMKAVNEFGEKSNNCDNIVSRDAVRRVEDEMRALSALSMCVCSKQQTFD